MNYRFLFVPFVILVLFAIIDLPASVSAEGGIKIDLGDGIKMEFVPISHGSFLMGDAADFDYSNEKPTRTVTISNSFYMGKHEMTQEQYQKIMGTNPSSFNTNPQQPVDQVSWYDAVSFCNKLSINQKLTPCYTNSDGKNNIKSGDTVNCNWLGNGYRLPTEAEWEYCCRAGTTTIFSCGNSFDSAYGWYNSNSSSKTHVVGTKAANPWGLHDMHGNLWEWCWDRYDPSYYTEGENTNPRGPDSGSSRVVRGGSWFQGPDGLRSAARNRFNNGTDFIGFRVLRTQ